MSDSLRLGQIRGITIRLHWTLLLLLGFLMLFSGSGIQLALLWGGVLVPIILLHELGHSVVAQHFGIRVLDITFWPLGGMARMDRIPENSRIEGLIAVAGPAVNFALALLALPLFLFGGPLAALGQAFVLFNLLLGLFNLLPAFPMDGGRVLRAALGRSGDWVRATERAVAVGRAVALLMLVAGLILMNPVLPLIGLFVWVSGGQELMAVRMRHGRPLFSFGGIEFPGAPPGQAPPRQAPFARPAPREADEDEDEDDDADEPVDEPRARRPVSHDGKPAGGWSQEDIRRIERFGGSLRQYPPKP